MARRAHVLLIDDDPLFRKLTAGLLRKFYFVTTAESGPEGLELALQHAPHVALIDVRMSGWNGMETLKRFRKERKLSAVKLAILTGDASRDTVISAIQCGADEYIVKTNFTKEELLRKVEEMVARSILPIEDAPETEPPRTAERGLPKVSQRKREPHQHVGAVNQPDPRLQDIIDDWE